MFKNGKFSSDNEENNSFISIPTATGNLIISGESSGATLSGSSFTVKKESNMPVKIFFKLMKKKMGILAGMRFENRIKRIEKMINEADENNQIAFSEELTKKLFVIMRESECYANGFKIFIEHDIYDKFKNKTERKVNLTPIKNYSRVIPKYVLKKKSKADELKLFDDYFIMHYDEAEAVKETEKETIEREKDPILFGVIEYSTRLYFLADWIDNYCDLTLDDIIDKLDLEEDDMILTKTPTL